MCLDSNFGFICCVLSSRPLTNLHLFPLCGIIYVDLVGVERRRPPSQAAKSVLIVSSAHLEEERSGSARACRANVRVVEKVVGSEWKNTG